MKFSWRSLASIPAYFVAIVSVAAAYPDHPIRIMVGTATGGGTDSAARLIAKPLSELWGQPVIIENHEGASDTIAADLVAHAAPDGYTLLMGSAPFSITAATLKLRYDPLKDFTPVAMMTRQMNILVINPKQLPVNSLKELIAYAKAHPGKLNFGSGLSDPPHLEMAYLSYLTGMNLVHVTYRGTAPEMTALLGDEIQLAFQSMSTGIPQVKAGKLRALAVSTNVRSPTVPDVPTVAEAAGLPDFDLGAWYGILAPAGTPKDVVEKLNGAITAAMDTPEAAKFVSDLGIRKETGSPGMFAEFIKKDIAKAKEIAKIIDNK